MITHNGCQSFTDSYLNLNDETIWTNLDETSELSSTSYFSYSGFDTVSGQEWVAYPKSHDSQNGDSLSSFW